MILYFSTHKVSTDIQNSFSPRRKSDYTLPYYEENDSSEKLRNLEKGERQSDTDLEELETALWSTILDSSEVFHGVDQESELCKLDFNI